jgi:hypothetical protein
MIGARNAWLVLGSLTLNLDNHDGGWLCSSLDLGQPDLREVKNNKPDQHGTIDRTAYMGGRLVTALITSWPGEATGSVDDVIEAFAPFLNPGARPVLHVTTYSNAPERTLTLRASQYSGGLPMTDPRRRDAQFQWVAPDPILRDTVTKSAVSWSGSTGSGRVYPLIFPRSYPTGGAQANGTIQGVGQVPIQPTLAVYGPITTPKISFRPNISSSTYQVWFTPGYQIPAGSYISVDTVNRTATLFPGGTNAMAAIDWINTVWPTLPNSPDSTVMILSGDPTGLVTTGITQVQASWQDGYLL